MKVEKHRLRRLGLAAAVLALTGCSTMAPSAAPSRMAFGGTTGRQPLVTTTMTGPPPLVQNCAIVAISSPTRYACNGKVYTSFELKKLREAWEKKMSQGASNSTPSNPESAPAKLASNAH